MSQPDYVIRGDRVYIRRNPCGQVFVTGIASSYDTSYPEVLHDLVEQYQYDKFINKLNDTLQSYWPCQPCFLFGYCFIPCTLGLSLLCPNYCISDAEEACVKELRDFSLVSYNYDRDIVYSLKRTCCSSYLEISFPKDLLKFLSDHNINISNGKDAKSQAIVQINPNEVKVNL